MAFRLSRPSRLAAGVCGLALCLAAAPAHAQESEPPAPAGTTGPTTYLPADFERFAPRNALDMLKQVPGFSIEAESDARGLGQASGNILINGKRPSSKSDSASDQLARIPAGNVIRIEIVDGATLDLPGLSGRVANIVAETGGISGQFGWTVQTETDFAAPGMFAGELSISGATGPLDYTLALTNSDFRGGSGGPALIYDDAGTVLETRDGASRSVSDNPKLSASFKLDGPGSSIANLNLSHQWSRFRSRELEQRSGVLFPDSDYALHSRKDGYNYEIGGDFEFALGPGRLKLIGLERFEHSDFDSQTVIDFVDDTPSIGDRFVLASDAGERIARAEYGWGMLGGTWQLSGEAAFNRLDNIAGLFALDPAGKFVEIPFPAGTGGVTEDRYEAILSYGRPLSDTLTMQLAVGGESSTIAQTGTNAEQRSFRRPKGSLSLAWAATGGLDIALEIRRAVGQLDFGDFLAEVSLDKNNANSGNNQLVPSQSWEVSLEATKNLGPWGSATLALYQHWIDDYVTIVPLPGPNPGQLVESQGNVDSARLFGIRLASTIQLEPLGFEGAKIDLDAEFKDSSIPDPLTGLKRRFDYLTYDQVEVDFRHDVPRSDWAWGLEFRHSERAPYYRLAEYGFDYSIGTFGGAFVEHKDVLGMAVRLRLANALGGKSVFTRTVFDGPRNAAPVAFVEDRTRRVGYFWNIIVKGNF